MFCLCLVNLGGEALHTHQYSPAGQGGRPVYHQAVRGDANTARLTPRLREHLVRTWIIVRWLVYIKQSETETHVLTNVAILSNLLNAEVFSHASAMAQGNVRK